MFGAYDYEDVGAAPYEEDCVQFPYNTPDKREAAQRENKRYVEYLKHIFGEIMPYGVSIKSKHNPYNADGGYLSAIVQYRSDDDSAAAFAIFVENNMPSRWITTKGDLHRLKCEWYGPSWQNKPDMLPDQISAEEAEVKVTIDEEGKVIEIS